MKRLLKSASYIFHPLWMPIFGSLLYFILSPRFFPPGVIKAKLLAIAIITIFIPIVFYFLLKNLGKATTAFLSDVKERRWPLFFFCLLMLMVLSQVLDIYNYQLLYYYYAGILFSCICCYFFSLFNLKISLHMLGLSGLSAFLIGLSTYFQLNLLYLFAFLSFATGLTASSRLFYKAHTPLELLLGILFGSLPQLAIIYLWF